MRMNKYQRFANALVEYGTVAEAGRQCKISSATAYRWSKRSEVVEAVRAIKKAKMNAVSAFITRESTTALSTIMDIVKNEKVNPQTRLQGAMFIIKTGYDRTDLDGLERRIEQLEDKANSLNY